MTVRTPPRPGLPVGLRAQRGSNALIAQYVRELSTRDTVRRSARASQRVAPRTVAQRS